MAGRSLTRTDEQQQAAQRCAASLTGGVPVAVVAGHYGVGKTNFALNLAFDVAASGRRVTLIDMDVVNPYFRSTEYRSQLEERGVRVVAPVFAERGSNLDVPSLTGAIVPAIQKAQSTWGTDGSAGDAQSLGQSWARTKHPRDVSARAELAWCTPPADPSCFRSQSSTSEQVGASDGGHQASSAATETVLRTVSPSEDCLSDWTPSEAPTVPGTELVIVDAGGDDVGVTALARFADVVKAVPYELLYVVNRYRNLTQTPEEALAVLKEIEAKSGLRASAVVGNSHLMEHTDREAVTQGAAFAAQVAHGAGLPLACVTAPSQCASPQIRALSFPQGEALIYPVQIYVRTPWDAV